MSGQTWGQESQTNYNLELREYKLLREFWISFQKLIFSDFKILWETSSGK
jgi:hypothetical protein